MEQGGGGDNPGFLKFIEKPAVKIQPLFIDPSPLGNNSGPGDGKSVGLEAQLFHKGYVFFITMVMIAGQIGVVVIENLVRRMGPFVPIALGRPVAQGRAFDLKRTSGGSP